MKVTNIVISLLFFLFAYFQYNDPDPWGWIALYSFIAVISAFAAFGKYNRYILWGGIGVIIITTAFLLPDFINWLKMGMPSITSSMKAEEPHIEYTREFLGLVLCLGVLIWQLWRIKK